VGKGRKALPRVRMIPGEAHRDRILSLSDEKAYFEATQAIGLSTLEMYQRALDGIRVTQRGQVPIEPRDPFLLRDVATVLLDCGIRPEECFRLRWEHVQNDMIEITYGKTDNARLVYRSLSVQHPSWKCVAAERPVPGSFPRRREAGISSLPAFRASMRRRAPWGKWPTSRCIRSAILV
jgi:integrase